MEVLPAKQQGIVPVSRVITFYCDDKNNKLVQTRVNIDLLI